MRQITDGFAKGAYTLGSFLKAQCCIFLNVLRLFKMYFYDNVRRKKKLEFVKATCTDFIRDTRFSVVDLHRHWIRSIKPAADFFFCYQSQRLLQPRRG